MHEHLIFFDAECPFCHKAVRHILDIDVDQKFLFSTFESEAAKEIFVGPQEYLTRAQSLVLVENYRSTARQFYIRSRAIFRIYWIIGHGWGRVGFLSFFPCWFSDLFYRFVSAHRHQFRLKMPKGPVPQDRFLQ